MTPAKRYQTLLEAEPLTRQECLGQIAVDLQLLSRSGAWLTVKEITARLQETSSAFRALYPKASPDAVRRLLKRNGFLSLPMSALKGRVA